MDRHKDSCDTYLCCVEGGSLSRKTNNKRPFVNHDDDDHEATIRWMGQLFLCLSIV